MEKIFVFIRSQDNVWNRTAHNMIYMGGARTLNKKLKAGAVSSLMTTDICIYPTEIACNPSQFTIKNNAVASMI